MNQNNNCSSDKPQQLEYPHHTTAMNGELNISGVIPKCCLSDCKRCDLQSALRIFSINSVPSKTSLDSRLTFSASKTCDFPPSSLSPPSLAPRFPSLPPPCHLPPPLALSSFLFFPFAFWPDPLFLYTRLICFTMLITAPASYAVLFTSYELPG